MTTPSAAARRYGPDVHEISLKERHVLLIGTAHISQESVDLVQRSLQQKCRTGSAWSSTTTVMRPRLAEITTTPPVSRGWEIPGCWNDKLLHVFLVFFFTGFWSTIWAWVGGYEIFKNLVG